MLTRLGTSTMTATLLRRLRDEEGAATAEYVIATMATIGMKR